ncbi:MAG: hypothetical protein IJ092_05340 [Atopobiaceae bacterium]|nr:hypothetical protein [Atopobiaceae bacterium]
MARRGRRALSRTVRLGSKDFEDAIAAYVEELCLDVEDQSIENVKNAGTKCVELLRANSRKPTGDYAKGFDVDVRVTRYGITATVHNRKKPGLTHLLEKGHDVIVNGRRVGHASGDGVIKAAAESVGGILYEGYD